MGAVGVLGVLPQRVPGLGCASSPHEVGLGEAPYTTPTWLGAEASKLGAHRWHGDKGHPVPAQSALSFLHLPVSGINASW